MIRLRGAVALAGLTALLALAVAIAPAVAVEKGYHLAFCYGDELYHTWKPLYLPKPGTYVVWLVNINPAAKPLENLWIWVYRPGVRILGVEYDFVFRPSFAGWAVGVSTVRPHMGTPVDPTRPGAGVVGYTPCLPGAPYFEPNPYTDYKLYLCFEKEGVYTVHFTWVEGGKQYEAVLTVVVGAPS